MILLQKVDLRPRPEIPKIRYGFTSAE